MRCQSCAFHCHWRHEKWAEEYTLLRPFFSLQHEYEELAVSLGTNHVKRKDLSNRLKSVRMTCPLFDTANWIRDLERVYLKMWAIHCQGRGPQTFEV